MAHLGEELALGAVGHLGAVACQHQLGVGLLEAFLRLLEGAAVFADPDRAFAGVFGVLHIADQVDPERVASGPGRRAADEAAHCQPQSRRQGAADDRELVRQGRTATAGTAEGEAVVRAHHSGRREVALVREPDRPGGGRERERGDGRRQEDHHSAFHRDRPLKVVVQTLETSSASVSPRLVRTPLSVLEPGSLCILRM